MGQVFRARDTRLGREVALKVLPDELSGSAERRSRLEQESRLLASLNHPRIASLFDVLDFEGSPVLVMEVVEGETLDERLSRGPLSFKAALELALAIAEGLEAAHEKGVLHRDLKPSNVKLTLEGGVKLLDFGLAKVIEADDSAATMPKPVERTETGVVMGTAPYMSPEQARGEPLNRRTDIWAFGCILFEMLTGRRAFPGATRADCLAAVLEREPDWASLPSGTPDGLHQILKRCLQKDPQRRLRDIADIRLELDELRSETAPGRVAHAHRRRVIPLVVAMAGLVMLAIAGSWFFRQKAPSTPSTEVRMPRFQLSRPHGVSIPGVGGSRVPLAISPDGDEVAFTGCASGVGCQLYLRSLSEIDARPLPGTEGATIPFFSPDGRFLLFEAKGKLKKMDLSAGSVLTLADAPQFRGGSFGEDGTVLFTRGGGGLLRVSAEGGEVQEVTKPDRGRNEYDHRWPHLLPGGRAALFEVLQDEGTIVAGSRGHEVAVADLDTGTYRVLLENAACPKHAAGHLLFGRDGIVYAASFDVDRLELAGAPVPVLEGVAMGSSPSGIFSFAGNVFYDFARDGTLLFSPLEARLPKRTLVLVDRNGHRRPVSETQRAYIDPAFSPDGRRIAVTVQTDVGTYGAFAVDIASGAWTRVGGEGDFSLRAWMPDGKRLLLGGSEGLLLAPVDGSEPTEILYRGEAQYCAVAPDGSAVLFSWNPTPAQWDISRLALSEPHEATPWLATPSSELGPSFSPDGRWVAYFSDESGRSEIYVREYSGSGARHQVSTQGGRSPRWSRDGREIFFDSQRSLVSPPVRAEPTFLSEPPRKLFPLPDEILIKFGFYDVSPDGRHFVMVERDPFELRPVELVVVPGFIEEMKARLATAR
jgi:serine/threonine-protein kinase